MADARVSKTRSRKGVWVRVPPSAIQESRSTPMRRDISVSPIQRFETQTSIRRGHAPRVVQQAAKPRSLYQGWPARKELSMLWVVIQAY